MSMYTGDETLGDEEQFTGDEKSDAYMFMCPGCGELELSDIRQEVCGDCYDSGVDVSDSLVMEIDEPSDEFDREADEIDERVTLSQLDVSEMGILDISFASVALMELNDGGLPF